MKVGSLVELIRPYEPHLIEIANKYNSPVPQLGVIYEVKDVGYDPDNHLNISLVEYDVKVTEEGKHIYYRADRFREIQPPTDLSEILEYQHPKHLLIN